MIFTLLQHKLFCLSINKMLKILFIKMLWVNQKKRKKEEIKKIKINSQIDLKNKLKMNLMSQK